MTENEEIWREINAIKDTRIGVAERLVRMETDLLQLKASIASITASLAAVQSSIDRASGGLQVARLIWIALGGAIGILATILFKK